MFMQHTATPDAKGTTAECIGSPTRATVAGGHDADWPCRVKCTRWPSRQAEYAETLWVDVVCLPVAISSRTALSACCGLVSKEVWPCHSPCVKRPLSKPITVMNKHVEPPRASAPSSDIHPHPTSCLCISPASMGTFAQCSDTLHRAHTSTRSNPHQRALPGELKQRHATPCSAWSLTGRTRNQAHRKERILFGLAHSRSVYESHPQRSDQKRF